MRISLIVHGFPPYELTGVENYTESLATALARAGHAVEVFAPRPAGELPNLALRREVRDGYAVTWMAVGYQPANPEELLNPPGVANRFGDFLDRERPDVVHFQHVVKLGTGLIAEAKRRGIPTVYTAHDYYACCHRYTLLRPDLQRCEQLGDPKACARCDLALAVLNEVEELGDYQMGAFEDQLSEKVSQRVTAILAGETKGTGFTKAEIQPVVRTRTELDEQRSRDFAELDLVLAPTLFLKERLVEGGLEAEKIQHLPYGIETTALEAVAKKSPVKRTTKQKSALRIGYFGGYSKHKGVHVLLEAFGKLQRPAQLSLHGVGSDRVYVESLRATAKEVGAEWCGPYASSELPALLATADLVVVPSLWVENYPIVIREALAAGRPVLTSRVGALPESVRDGVDGLLFEPGDSEQLAALLDRCASEAGLLQSLAKAIEPVHSMEAQVAELEDHYRAVTKAAKPKPSRAIPGSLVGPLARYDELSQLPTRELFVRAMTGLQTLGDALLSKSSPGKLELLTTALARDSKAQDQLRDRRRESDWVRQTLSEKEHELSDLSRKVEWMNEVVDGREQEVETLKRERSWLSDSIRAKKSEADSLAQERDEVARARASLDEQREWLETAVEGKTQEIEELRRKLEWLDGGLETKQQAIDELERKTKWLEEQLEDARARIAELESSQAEGELARTSLTEKCQWLEDSLEATRQELTRTETERDDHRAARQSLEEKEAWLEGVLRDKEAAVASLEALVADRQSAVESQELKLTEQAAQLESQEAQLAEQAVEIQRHEEVEYELRAWVEASREVLDAFVVEEFADGEIPGSVAELATRLLKENWASLLVDVERLLDSEDSEVAPDELSLEINDFLHRLDTEERELQWRRNEMEIVREHAQLWKGRFSLMAGKLHSRVIDWTEDSKGGSPL